MTMHIHHRPAFRYALLGCFLAFPSLPLAAQDSPPPKRARDGSQFWIPAMSLLIPGFGQFLQGDPAAGVVYGGVALGGFTLSKVGDADVFPIDELPRSARDQLAFEGIHLMSTAGALSAWDAFHRAVPALQIESKYEFLGQDEDDLVALLTAPFDTRFLSRWTTWVELAYTAAITTLVLHSRREDVDYDSFRAQDALFVTALSVNAGVGEEALFRGWLLPFFHQNFDDRFWLANAAQAGIFGGLHAPQAKGFAAVIGVWGLFEGWLTRRNGWSVRESIFHHFWYDVAVVTATLVADESAVVRLTAPTIRF